jgi:hypothetical protein
MDYTVPNQSSSYKLHRNQKHGGGKKKGMEQFIIHFQVFRLAAAKTQQTTEHRQKSRSSALLHRGQKASEPLLSNKLYVHGKKTPA